MLSDASPKQLSARPLRICLQEGKHFIIERRFGLRGTDPLSLRATGEATGITKGQAQALEALALNKLRSQPSAGRWEPV